MAIKAADQITITDITDAYSVILTSEAFTFVGGTGGAASGSSCSTDAVAYCGTNQCSNVSVTQSAIKFYNAAGTEVTTGISASVTNSGTSKVTITFSLSATLSDALEADIPVVVDGITVHKKFSLAVAKTGQTGQTGATGRGISSTVTEYQSSTSNTTVPTGTWTTTIPSVDAGKYLWTRITINYTSGDPTVSYSVAKQGATGTTGSQWYAGTGITGTSTTPTIFSGSGVSNARVNDCYLNTDTGNTYICTTAGAASTAKWKYTGNIKGVTGDTGNGVSGATITYASSTSNTTAPTSGWQSTPPSVAAGSYLWTKTVFSYTDGTSSDPQYSVAKQGATGAAGADAITVSVTSSNGTVFKNNSGSTILTAHVYKAGAEKTVNASTGVVADSLGTIKWYKGAPSDTQPTGWPKAAGTLTIAATDVANVQAYTCQLES